MKTASKLTRTLSALWALMALLMALSLAACGTTQTAVPSEEPVAETTATPELPATPEIPTEPATPETPEAVTVTDYEGREVTFEKTPERIVSLVASSTEIVYALGCGDKMVGADSYSDYPAETADLPKVGDYTGPNVEAILALEPDVVFAAKGIQGDVISQLEALGAVVVVNEATTYDQIFDSIEMTAKILGADAQPVIDAMKAREAEAVALAAADGNTPSVYYVVSFGEYGDYTIGQGAFMTDILAKINARSVTAEVEVPWPSYSMEQIIADDPDYIVLSGAWMYDVFTTSDGYKDLRAVKEGHVFAVDENASSRPAPRLMDVMYEIAEKLHSK